LGFVNAEIFPISFLVVSCSIYDPELRIGSWM